MPLGEAMLVFVMFECPVPVSLASNVVVLVRVIVIVVVESEPVVRGSALVIV